MTSSDTVGARSGCMATRLSWRVFKWETLGFAIWEERRVGAGEAVAHLSDPGLMVELSRRVALWGGSMGKEGPGCLCAVHMPPALQVQQGTIREALGTWGCSWGRDRKAGQGSL